MAEKIFSNVRLGLKVDTLENWQSSSLVLKRGEVAFATIAASAGTGLTEPVCMMKIGDGEHTFSQLDFDFYAKAADVISACKSESALTAFVNNIISGAGIATDEALATLAGRVTTAESNITALQGLVGNKKVSEQISSAITALNLADTYAAKSHTHTKSEITDFAHTHAMTEVTGLTDAIADAKKAGTDANTALESYKATNNAAVKANADAIAAINAVDTGILAQAKSYADGKDTAMDTRVDALEAAVGTGGSVDTKISDAIGKLDKEDAAVAGQYVSAVSETDGVITVTRAALPDYTDTYAPKTHTHAIADVTGLQDALDGKVDDADFTTLDGKVTTLIGSDADKSVRTIANEELAAQLIPENAKEALDTLGEIAAWIQSHPDNASAMNAAIEALQTKVGDTSVSAQIATAINDLKNGDIKSATDRIAALEADTHTHSNKALLDTYTQTEANLADAVAKKHEHANKEELDKIASGDKAKWDAAVQTLTASTGLTATKTGTDVAIGIDDTVTWIFDCGTSAV